MCIRDALGMHGGDSEDALGSVGCRDAFELFVYIGNGVRGSLRGCSGGKKIVKIVKFVKILKKIVEEDCMEGCIVACSEGCSGGCSWDGESCREDCSEICVNDCSDCCSGSSTRCSSEDW